MEKAFFLALAPLLFFGCTQNVEDKNADCQKYQNSFPENARTENTEIFYSPKTESCLVVVTWDGSHWDSDLGTNVFPVTKKLVNATNEEVIFETTKTNSESLPTNDEFTEFNKIVAEYKN